MQRYRYSWLLFLGVMLQLLLSVSAHATNIDPDNDGLKYAYGENVGWINLAPSQGGGVTVTATALTGQAWGENIGWIIFNPATGGVVNDGAGNLSGTAWGENVGWINFRPVGGGVTISATGLFSGRAYGENIGWISFGSDGPAPYHIKTSWLAPPSSSPAPFSFPPVTDVSRNALTVSAVVTITGINVPTPIAVTGGAYAVNGGEFTSESGMVTCFDTVQVRQMSSGLYATTTTATLTIGDQSAGFAVTTALDTPPTVDTFSLPERSFSLTVPVTLTASDNSSVTGYFLSEASATPVASDPGWKNTKPANHTFANLGSRTLYAWARDDAGAVSAPRSATVLITASAPVLRTGQTTCWNAEGNPTSCYGTGQDGATRSGTAWPVPRFSPHGEGMLTDTLTGLIWPQNEDTVRGTMTWQQALEYIQFLNSPDHPYLGYTDWRLPNINELKSLVNLEENDQAAWLGRQGFSNFRNYYYWSSTTYAGAYADAWVLYQADSSVQTYSKGNLGNVRPVRGASILPVTGQTTCSAGIPPYYARECAGSGQDGETPRGVGWPDPRFSDNGNGTVTDTLTNLIWTRDGNPADVTKEGSPTVGAMSWQQAVEYIAGLNRTRYLGFNDWRLPNPNELTSVVKWGIYNNATWWLNDAGFSYVQPGRYWSSSIYVPDTRNAWAVSLNTGAIEGYYKPNTLYVWPVRGGLVEYIAAPPATYTVNFVSNGGSAVSSQTIPATATATVPPAPTRFFYTFAGWYSDINLTTLFSFSTPITADTTLYAKWTSAIIPLFTVKVTVTGAGTITCDSPVLKGAASVCTISPDAGYHLDTFTDNMQDKLPAVSGGKYTISTVSSDHAIAGKFVSDVSDNVRIGTGTTPYATLQSAFAGAKNGDTIKARGIVFTGPLTIAGLTATLYGGYDADFAVHTGYTTLTGSMTIVSGGLVVDRLVIR